MSLTVSVVIPARNAAQILPRCLASLKAQTRLPDEIIVADDGSSDDTAAIAEQFGARSVRLAPKGPGAARNAGAQLARGDLLLFTDSDCEPLPDWVERMTAPFTDPRVMGVKGAYQCRQTELIARLIQAEFEEKYARMRQLPQIDFIDTYSAAYRRATFEQVGGFNETFPTASVEDVELSFRLAEAGARLVFAPDAQVWHRHPTSLIYYLRRKGRYGYWRALVYLWHPTKIGGDSHTDPGLKQQFLLAGLAGLSLFSVVWSLWGLMLTGGLLLWLLATTLPFAQRVWARDKGVALIAPGIHTLRAIVQAATLAIGLSVHGLARWLGRGPSPFAPRQP